MTCLVRCCQIEFAFLYPGTESLWEVPIGICTASSPQKSVHRFVLNEKEATVTIDNIKPNDWIKVISCLLAISD